MSHAGSVRRRLVGVVVVLAGLSFGCAGDGDDPEAAASSTSTTAVEDPEGHEADDRELAESIVIKESDLPADIGWTATPSEEDPEGEAALRSCLGLPPESREPGAESPTFSVGDVTRVDSSATVAASVDSANEVFVPSQAADSSTASASSSKLSCWSSRMPTSDRRPPSRSTSRRWATAPSRSGCPPPSRRRTASASRWSSTSS